MLWIGILHSRFEGNFVIKRPKKKKKEESEKWAIARIQIQCSWLELPMLELPLSVTTTRQSPAITTLYMTFCNTGAWYLNDSFSHPATTQ